VRAVDDGPAPALKTPRVAGVAGVVSALLVGATMVLIRVAIPTDPTGGLSWTIDPSQRHALQVGVTLVPFAGIFFLWFMGAVRDYVGQAEDKFFATLFLGAGLLFVAMMFVLSAEVTSGLDASADPAQQSTRLQFVLTLLSSYATRMAAVFTIAATTIGRGLGIFPKWLVALGYVVAVVLLLLNMPWLELIFPVWIVALSSFIFLTNPARQARTPVS
jgi:hypothetical protein